MSEREENEELEKEKNNEEQKEKIELQVKQQELDELTDRHKRILAEY